MKVYFKVMAQNFETEMEKWDGVSGTFNPKPINRKKILLSMA